jgi:hypothetical protein
VPPAWLVNEQSRLLRSQVQDGENRDTGRVAVAEGGTETGEGENREKVEKRRDEGLSSNSERSMAYFMGSLRPQCRFISHYLSAKAG